MSAVTSPPPKLLTAEEYAALPDEDCYMELVDGEIVRSRLPGGIHGHVCAHIACELGQHVRDRDLGRVLIGTGIITRRNPDCVRGPDVSYFCFDRLPRGPLPTGYPEIMPELVVEVIDQIGEWKSMTDRIMEYHTAGVSLVVLLDPEGEVGEVYRGGELGSQYQSRHELTFPGVLPDLRIPIGPLFA